MKCLCNVSYHNDYDDIVIEYILSNVETNSQSLDVKCIHDLSWHKKKKSFDSSIDFVNCGHHRKCPWSFFLKLNAKRRVFLRHLLSRGWWGSGKTFHCWYTLFSAWIYVCPISRMLPPYVIKAFKKKEKMFMMNGTSYGA